MTPQELVASLDSTRRRELEQITRVQATAWPTVILCVILVTGVAASDVLALTGVIPLWAGLIANSLLGYLAFSVAHDAIQDATVPGRQPQQCAAPASAAQKRSTKIGMGP